MLVALIVLGPSKLPEAARKVGQAMNEFRRMSSGFQAELRDALDPIDIKGDLNRDAKLGNDELPVVSVEEADRAALGQDQESLPDSGDHSAY